MADTIRKLFFLIKTSNLKKSYILLNFFLILNLFFELIGIGILIPLINFTIDPSSFANLINKYDMLSFLNNSQEKLAVYFIYLVSFIFVFKILIGVVYTWVVQNFIAKFEDKLATLTLTKYYEYYDSYFLSKIEDLFTSVSHRTSRVAASTIFFSNLVSESIIFIIIFIFLLITSSTYALISGFFLISISFLIFKFSNIRIKKYSFERSIHLTNKSNSLKEFFDGIREIIIYLSGNILIKKFREENLKYLKPQKKIGFLNTAPKFIFESLIFLTVVLILLNFSQNQNSQAVLFEIGIFIVLLLRILPSVNRILLNFNNFRYTFEPIETLASDLKVDQEIFVHKEFNFNNSIKIKELSFAYNSSDKIFEELNFEIKKNTKIIFLGNSGVGKSTLIDLMIGILKPSSGEVIIDDKYAPTLSKNWLSLVSYVPQKSYIHNESIKFNITFEFDTNHINENLYNKALKISGLDKIISNGLDDSKDIGQFGSLISGGQKQRISIARAIYKDAPIIIMDEATNAIDIESEKVILDKLLKLEDKTIIMVTHRDKNLDKFDNVYKVEANKITSIK